MPECPTPDKAAYHSEGRARRGAAAVARARLEAREHFPPMYIYRCPCGALHLTRRSSWDGQSLELLYEVADHLQAFALERPTS